MELAAADFAAGARRQDSAAEGHGGTPGLGPASLGAISADGMATVRAECAMACTVGDALACAGGSGRESLFTPPERMLGAPQATAPAAWGEGAAAGAARTAARWLETAHATARHGDLGTPLIDAARMAVPLLHGADESLGPRPRNLNIQGGGAAADEVERPQVLFRETSAGTRRRYGRKEKRSPDVWRTHGGTSVTSCPLPAPWQQEGRPPEGRAPQQLVRHSGKIDQPDGLPLLRFHKYTIRPSGGTAEVLYHVLPGKMERAEQHEHDPASAAPAAVSVTGGAVVVEAEAIPAAAAAAATSSFDHMSAMDILTLEDDFGSESPGLGKPPAAEASPAAPPAEVDRSSAEGMSAQNVAEGAVSADDLQRIDENLHLLPPADSSADLEVEPSGRDQVFGKRGHSDMDPSWADGAVDSSTLDTGSSDHLLGPSTLPPPGHAGASRTPGRQDGIQLPAKIRKVLATTLSVFSVAALLLSEDPEDTVTPAAGTRQLSEGNMLGLYHNANDDRLLVGGFHWRSFPFRRFNLGQPHRATWVMLAALLGHTVVAPTCMWLRRTVLEGWLQWDMHGQVLITPFQQLDKIATAQDGQRPRLRAVLANACFGFILATFFVVGLNHPWVVFQTRLLAYTWVDDLLGTTRQFSRLRAFITMSAMRVASYAVVFELAAALVQLVPSVSTDVAGAGTVDVAAIALAVVVWAVDVTVHRQHVRRARWACWLAVFLTLRCVDLLLSGQFVGDVFSSLHSGVLAGTVVPSAVCLVPVLEVLGFTAFSGLAYRQDRSTAPTSKTSPDHATDRRTGRWTANQPKILATAFSAFALAAMLLNDVDRLQGGNVLRLYHNASDERMLVGAVNWHSAAFRNVNLGHRHRVAWFMLVACLGHSLFTPLTARFQRTVLEGRLQWDMHEMAVHSIFTQIDRYVLAGKDGHRTALELCLTNFASGLPLVVFPVFSAWALAGSLARLVLSCWRSDLHGREESSRIRAFLAVITIRIASYAAAMEASAVLVQAGALAIAAAVPADAFGIAAGDLSVVGVLSAVACIDLTMHRRCVRRWRWLAFASMWAGFCCVDLALGVNLGCLGHLQPYVGPTMAALCLAAVLHWVIVWWDDLTETTKRL